MCVNRQSNVHVCLTAFFVLLLLYIDDFILIGDCKTYAFYCFILATRIDYPASNCIPIAVHWPSLAFISQKNVSLVDWNLGFLSITLLYRVVTADCTLWINLLCYFPFYLPFTLFILAPERSTISWSQTMWNTFRLFGYSNHFYNPNYTALIRTT